jgi:hypothetical protein
MGNIHLLVFMFLALGCLSSSTGIAAEGDKIPSDFRLAAEFYPSYVPRRAEGYPAPTPWKPWYPWTVTITANGRALQETDVSVDDENKLIRKSFRLTRQDLAQLVRAVQDSRFYLLATEYRDNVTDNPTLILSHDESQVSRGVGVRSGSSQAERRSRGILERVERGHKVCATTEPRARCRIDREYRRSPGPRAVHTIKQYE